MDRLPTKKRLRRAGGFLRALAQDRTGNTLALIAASIFPMLGLIGGGIDMGRAYLAESRLQQACDAGVLAARKQLGTEPAVTGTIPGSVSMIGSRFFNINFRDGTYGTENRDFAMTLENDFAISAVAKVEVPTSIMTVFGFETVPIQVSCAAELSLANLDMMMVLDVTGSMRHTNAGDSQSRIETLKGVIRSFHAQMEAAKVPGGRLRYGFVPYATNVNVGHLLSDDWVVDQWTYQSREVTDPWEQITAGYSDYNFVVISGEVPKWEVESTYASPDGGCDTAPPEATYTRTDTTISQETTPFAGPPAGEQTHYQNERFETGNEYDVVQNGDICEIRVRAWVDVTRSYTRWIRPYSFSFPQWIYGPISSNVSQWRDETEGCVEERSTYAISDYDNVDLNAALDLNLDAVPTAGMPDTQWRPQYPEKIYARSFTDQFEGSFHLPAITSQSIYSDTGNWWFSSCPAKAQKLAEMDADQVDAFLATLDPYGATYHDIGMLWGGRLMSPNGLFAAENQDVDGIPTGRHMIFLTDGQTEAYDLAYGAYGVEGLDRRRWSPDDAATLNETVESRFSFACEEVKKRNITVWVIAFGTYLNQAMLDCAGEGRYFEAASSDELNGAFTSIARSIGDLRISR